MLCLSHSAYRTHSTPRAEEFAGSTLDAYAHTRAAASLFDISFKVCLQITGARMGTERNLTLPKKRCFHPPGEVT